MPEVIRGFESCGITRRGGMGEVHKATWLKTGKTVAVKLLPAEQRGNKARRRRFLIEPNCLARLDHPNIVRLYGFGEHDGRPYFLMPWIEGATVAELAARSVSVGGVLALGVALADALAHCHARRIVHRDLKRSNVLVRRRDGRVKLIDFSLARRLDFDDPRSEEVVPATDVLGLGSLLYRLLCGRRPFAKTEPTPLPPPSPALLHPACPPDLASLVLECLAKRPTRRPTADAVAAVLRHIAASRLDRRGVA